jgi:hypothetical protein
MSYRMTLSLGLVFILTLGVIEAAQPMAQGAVVDAAVSQSECRDNRHYPAKRPPFGDPDKEKTNRPPELKRPPFKQPKDRDPSKDKYDHPYE